MQDEGQFLQLWLFTQRALGTELYYEQASKSSDASLELPRFWKTWLRKPISPHRFCVWAKFALTCCDSFCRPWSIWRTVLVKYILTLSGTMLIGRILLISWWSHFGVTTIKHTINFIKVYIILCTKLAPIGISIGLSSMARCGLDALWSGKHLTGRVRISAKLVHRVSS